MKKLLSKAKPKSSSQSSSSTQTHQPSTISPPTPTDVFRYRYIHGVNLGSVFVLEKWLFPSMFPSSATGGSELDAVTASVREIGMEGTKERWEGHWRGATAADAGGGEEGFEWLVREARCNGIRLPIGYFTLGPEWCLGTGFEGVKGVYEGSWGEVKRFIGRARGWGVGVLIDFHAVYGGANGEAHSGTGSGKAGLWGNRRELERAKRALGWIAGELRGVEGVVGIQVVNEAVWDGKGMYAWYEEVIEEIGQVDESIPIYISDGWDLKRALEWTNKRRLFGGGKRNPVVVDTHRYYTFSESDRNQTPQQIIARIPGELGELDGKEGSLTDRGEAQVIIGEWSCVLDGRTWGRVRPEEKDGFITQFGHAQSQKWQQRAGGSYFWTYKMDWMDGGEWGFVEQTKKENVISPAFLTLHAQEIRNRIQVAQARRLDVGNAARRSHEEYWNRTCPGKRFEHELYGEGWDVGFSDAQKFFAMRIDGALGGKVAGEGGDKIGCLEIWMKKRLLESGKRGEFVWEWEQGFRTGVGAFYHAVGI